VAAHLIRLKLTLLRNQLRGSVGQTVGLVLSIVGGLFVALLLVVGLVYLRTLPVDDAGTWVTVAGAAAITAWLVAPLASLGSDQTLDPGRFVTFAIPHRQLVTGLLAGSLVGVPAGITAVAALGTVVVWTRDVLSAVVAVAGGVVGLLTCLVVTRASGTALAILQNRRRFREVAMSVGVVLLIGVSFVPFMVTQGVIALSEDLLEPVAGVLALTPLGWAWSAPWDAATGSVLVALGKLVLAAALVPLLMRVWAGLLARHLAHPTTSGRAVTRARRSVLAAVPGAVGAVADRCLKYWRRDPRYSLSLVIVFVLPLLVLVLVPLGWISLQTWGLVVAPVVGYVLGWGLHNDIAYDADPWWMHLAAHVPGRADRAGRVLASAVWGLPVLVLAALGGAVLAGRPEMLPAVLGLSLAFAGAGYGVSSVAAVLAPYWAPAPGENPNATPPGAGGLMMLAQFVTGTATLVGAVPAVVPYVLAWQGSTTASWLTLLVGAVLGGALTVIGVVVGGRVMDRRGPELLATVRK